MNELISTLIGLNAMHDTHIISEDDYVSNLGQLCGEYGTNEKKVLTSPALYGIINPEVKKRGCYYG